MTEDERRQIEQRAERALRRGELGEAHGLLRQVVEVFPTDAALQQRVALLAEDLQPGDLLGHPTLPSYPTPPPISRVDEAERLVDQGDFNGAISIYKLLLTQTPEAELLSERLAELLPLAQSRASHPPPKKDTASMLTELLKRLESRRRR